MIRDSDETLTEWHNAFRAKKTPYLLLPAVGVDVATLPGFITAAASASGVSISLAVFSDSNVPPPDALSLSTAFASRFCPLSFPGL